MSGSLQQVPSKLRPRDRQLLAPVTTCGEEHGLSLGYCEYELPVLRDMAACRAGWQTCRCPYHHKYHSSRQHTPNARRVICCAAVDDDQAEPTNPAKPNELSQQDSEVFIQGSDTDFLIKLLLISVGGAVIIKYGSLVLDAPFQPDAGLGLTLVIGPCLVYSIALLFKSKQETSP